ncbi:hypothetical protein GW17_00059145 [Ensete ventricosum]|nr:hypothetical protein GW17_00059145 [Ensete ventricosum]
MLLLRFPNSGIRAKIFVRKIGFKLRVMRLNHVESFYSFLLRYYSERCEEGQPATAKPPAGGRPPARGSRHQAHAPMARTAASKRGRSRAWLPPIGVVPTGVGSTRKSGAHGGAPFGDNASSQGRRLRAQHPQELSPKG